MSRARATPIAIVGMAGRFPGANSVDVLWDNVRRGRESVTRFTEDELARSGVPASHYRDPTYVPVNGVIDGVDQFDNTLFDYSPREAALTDPQQRLLLECAWAALEHAGRLQANATAGVFVGVGPNSYLMHQVLPHKEITNALGALSVLLANEKDHAATRIAYKLRLRGPALTVQTACSTSLVAVHLAALSLAAMECDVAVAGAAAITFPQVGGYFYQAHDIGSPDGHCRAFDRKAKGTIPGDGVALVVLRRLADAIEDGDEIYAMIRGSAINNDAGDKVGYTAPSVRGQADVIRAALQAAAAAPSTIGYIEAHGTGTEIGDAIEAAAILQAFRAEGGHSGRCALGSLKPNIGHLDAAAGVAGLIKATQALRHGILPPTINVDEPNPEIPFDGEPLFIVTEAMPWNAGESPRRCGVSSFGMGGTNAHVILEEAPPRSDHLGSPGPHLLVASAKTPESLDIARSRVADRVAVGDLALADVAGTLREGRAELECRSAAVLTATAEASRFGTAPVRRARRPRNVAFLLPGQGAQREGMLAGLCDRFPVVAEAVDTCARHLMPHLGLDLAAVLCGRGVVPPGAVNETWLAQPLLFVAEYALAQLLETWGVRPTILLGHSIGEYVAATLSGGFALADALELVAARGRLMDGAPRGGMLAVDATETAILDVLPASLSLACINGPLAMVVSGPLADLNAFAASLAERSVSSKRLRVSHAFHSTMMQGSIQQRLAELASAVEQRPLSIPIASNLTGGVHPPGYRYAAEYWADHLVSTVRFEAGVRHVLAKPDPVLIEVGPGSALSTLVHRYAEIAPRLVETMLAEVGDPEENVGSVLAAAGNLWADGVLPSIRSVDAGAAFRRVPLPGYAFARTGHRLGGPGRSEPSAPSPSLVDNGGARRENAGAVTEELAGLWRSLLGVEEVGDSSNFFALGGDSLLMVRLIAQAKRSFGVQLAIRDVLSTPTLRGIADQVLKRRAAA